MKTITFLASLLFAVNSFAELKWARGPFWKTMYDNSFLLQLESLSAEINDECIYFENIVQDANGTLFDIESVDFIDIDSLALPSDVVHQNFQLDFKLLVPVNLTVASELQNRSDIFSLVKAETALDILPSYTQLPTEIRLLDQTFLSIPQIQKQSSSLVAVADRLAVTIKTPQFIRSGANIFLRVNSKALACDLLNGRASLKMAALALVKITLDSQIKLQTEYSDVENIAVSLMAKSKNPRIRAALFGFRMGELLVGKNTGDTAQMENRMLALLDKLFDSDKMSPSFVWEDGINQKTLSISGTSAPVDVQLEIHAKK